MSERASWGTWAMRGIVLVVAFTLGALAGATVTNSSARDAEARLTQANEDVSVLRAAQENLEERNWTLYRQNNALRSEAGSRTAAPGVSSEQSTEASGGAGSGWSDGIWLVGTDIEPGTYRGTVTAGSGYWARLKGTTGMVNDIIVNGVPRGPFVLTINPSDEAVELRGVELSVLASE